MLAGTPLVLDLACNRKELHKVKELVESLHGKVQLVINKATKLLVTDAQQWTKQTSKAKFAQKYAIPIVDQSYLYLCQSKGRLLPPRNYPPPSAEISKDDVTTSAEEKKLSILKGKFMQRPQLACPTAESTPYNANDDSGYFIAQNHFFLKIKGSNTLFHALELHVHESVLRSSNSNEYSYRIYEEVGTTKLINTAHHTRQIRVVDNIASAEVLYESIYSSLIKKGYQLAKIVSPKIGSELIKSSLTGCYTGGISFLPIITQNLVSTIFQCSLDKLYEKAKLIPNSNGVLHNSFGTLSLSAIEKAESILAIIENNLVSPLRKDTSELEKEYTSLTLQQSVSLRTLKDIDNQKEICSLVRDVSVSGEGLINNSFIDSKYRSLSCRILQANQDEFKYVKQFVNDTIKTLDLPRITNVFHLDKNGEYGSFSQAKTSLPTDKNTEQLLFHGSAAHNILGIIARGLLTPHVSNRLKGERRDYGKLGAGIYFSPSAEAAIYYSDSNPKTTYAVTKGYFFICEVLLGNIHVTENEMPLLTSAPSGCHSTHGRRSGRGSFRDHDEYCIYQSSQQRLKYLVEFDYSSEKQMLPAIVPAAVNVEEICSNVITSEKQNQEAEAVEEQVEEDILPKVVKPQAYGLLASDGGQFPLQACHIRGNLLDVIGKVLLFQEYFNSQKQAVEAKYVFPIDGMSAVCGFEAYINGKYVVGEVKEKAQAKKEYKEAIEAGHGAYLMDRDEDAPEVWTVSVGNIPPGAKVLIKITYITELQIQGEDILFYLPTNINSSTSDRNLLEGAQASSNTPTTLELGIDMPFSILDIKSPSHENSLIIKVTEAKAMIKFDNKKFPSFEGKDFVIAVTLEDAHKPRMWLENNGVSTAAMLVFYPEFEFAPSLDYEIIFLIDRSFSMGADSTRSIKQAIRAAIKNLPSPAYLNCIAFGSYTEKLFIRSMENSSQNVDKLMTFINELPSNMGGSDLFTALNQIYLTMDRTRASRTIFLFSDGYYNDCEKKLLPFVQQNADHTRLFTFGISGSEGVSKYILQSIAKAGCGSFELLEDINSREQLIVNQLYHSLQPTIREISVDWKNAKSITQAPKQIPNVFNGERQIVYGIIDGCTYADLVSKGADGELFSCRVSVTPERNVRTDYIHKLAARSMIRDYEEGSLSDNLIDDHVEKYLQKGNIIELSCKYNVACSLTSFIAVEHRSPAEQKAIKEGKALLSIPTPALDELLKDENIDPLPELSWGSGVKEMRKRTQTTGAHVQAPSEASVAVTEVKETEVEALSSLDKLLAEIGSALSGEHTESVCESVVVPYESSSTIDDYELQAVIGKGRHGKIISARKKQSKEVIAIKVMPKDEENIELSQIGKLIEVSKKSRFLVEMKDVFSTEDKNYIINEQVRGGELFFHLSNKRCTEDTIKFYAAELALALEKLHKNDILSLQLSPEQCLLTETGHLKLSDFGIFKANIVPQYNKAIDHCYTCPEALKGATPSKCADYWNMGALLYEAFFGLPICHPEGPHKPPRFGGKPCSAEFQDLVNQLLQPDPNKRLCTINNLKNHPWFSSINWKSIKSGTIPAPFIPPRKTPSDTCCIDPSFLCEDPVLGLDDVELSCDNFEGFTYVAPAAFEGFTFIPEHDNRVKEMADSSLLIASRAMRVADDTKKIIANTSSKRKDQKCADAPARSPSLSLSRPSSAPKEAETKSYSKKSRNIIRKEKESPLPRAPPAEPVALKQSIPITGDLARAPSRPSTAHAIARESDSFVSYTFKSFSESPSASASFVQPVQEEEEKQLKVNKKKKKMSLFAMKKMYTAQDRKAQLSIGTPYSVSHSIHVDFNSDVGFTGLPPGWEVRIRCSGLTKQQAAEDSSILYTCLNFEDVQESYKEVVGDYLALTSGEPNRLYHLNHDRTGCNLFSGQLVFYSRISHSRCSLNTLRLIAFAQSPHNNIFPAIENCFFHEKEVVVVTNAIGVCLDDILCFPDIQKMITEEIISYICHQMLLLIIQFTENNLVHEQLDTRNIFVNSFGELTYGFPHTSVCVSNGERPPEIIDGGPHTEKAHVYAVGMTIYNLVTGEPPLMDFAPLDALYRAYKHEIPFPSAKDQFSDCIKEFYSACTTKDSKIRLSASQLLMHPFITNNNVSRGKSALKALLPVYEKNKKEEGLALAESLF